MTARVRKMARRFDVLGRDGVDVGLVVIASAGLAAGAWLWSVGGPRAGLVWSIATAPVLAALVVQIARSLARGDIGLDIVAALSMSAALLFDEPLAANLVALMYSGGQLLESYAEGRARRDMTALLGRVSRTAMRYAGDRLEETPIAAIVQGDRLMMRAGEALPVDGHVANGVAVLDLSALTGESLPRTLVQGEAALSGSSVVGAPFTLIASRPAAESTYAGIVRLVEAAQASRAPMARLADRFAIWFLLLTIAIAGAALLATGDSSRMVAVLVVATPCPLILAVPVAIIAGMSRGARQGALIKSGGALEKLARVRTAVLDKTGTLTMGRAEIVEIRRAGGFEADDVLRHAASLDQASAHVVADALIAGAARRGLTLAAPTDVSETPGKGVEGLVEGRRVAIGGEGFVGRRCGGVPDALPADAPPGALLVAVAIEGRCAGVIILRDRLREDAAATLAALRAAGVERIVLATGDRSDIAAAIGKAAGVDAVLGDLTPAGKQDVIRAEQERGATMMVGDGVNDAPALATADVGVALAARGAAASSEAADIVLLVDRLEPLARTMGTARRTRAIALQSVFAGLGLSLAGMIAAALGHLPAAAGALFQEAIDVAVILNALRALR